MRPVHWVGALALLLLAGCGMHDLVLRVDILSFTPQLQSSLTIGPVPAVPGGLASGELPLVADETVNLVEGLGSAVNVKDVSLRIRTATSATSGSGTDTLRVYTSDAGTAPRTTTPVLTQVLAFTTSRSDTVTTEISQNAQLIQLFTAKTLRVSITMSGRGPNAGSPLNGSLRVLALDAVVVAGRKL